MAIGRCQETLTSINYLDTSSSNLHLQVHISVDTMASTSTRRESENVLDNLCVRLGSLILKEEQKLAVEALLSLKDVMVVLPTGSGNP